MSEPASFFLHAHITESNLEKFFHSPATNIKDHDDWLPWFIEKQRLYGDPAKMLNNLAACNSGESEKNIYAEHINFNKETQIVTMDLSQRAMKSSCHSWPVCGESRSLLRQGKIILR